MSVAFVVLKNNKKNFGKIICLLFFTGFRLPLFVSQQNLYEELIIE